MEVRELVERQLGCQMPRSTVKSALAANIGLNQPFERNGRDAIG